MSKLTSRVLKSGSDPELADFLDEITTYWNAGRYQLQVLDAAPTYAGQDGEAVIANYGGTRYLFIYLAGVGWEGVALAP